MFGLTETAEDRGAEWAKSLQQYGEDATDLDSILLDSTTEFLS
jgi:hypothetical protein